jgi:hypothetical protein
MICEFSLAFNLIFNALIFAAHKIEIYAFVNCLRKRHKERERESSSLLNSLYLHQFFSLTLRMEKVFQLEILRNLYSIFHRKMKILATHAQSIISINVYVYGSRERRCLN